MAKTKADVTTGSGTKQVKKRTKVKKVDPKPGTGERLAVISIYLSTIDVSLV